MANPTFWAAQPLRDLDGKQIATFNVEIDWEAIRRMAHKAFHAKTGKSQDGPVRVVITDKKGGKA